MRTVSIITLNGGRAGHLARLLEGLSRGDRPAECIVVQMGGEEVALPRTAFDLKQVKLGRAGLPLAAARNAGRRAAGGEILIFLDVDCIPSGNLVTALSGHAANCDALICCAVTYLPADAVSDGWTETGLQRVGQRHPARTFPADGLVPAPHPGLFWSLAFAVRTTVFDRIGGFDEDFEGYGGEDTDFAFRADALGIPVLFSAAGQAFHQWHPAFDPPLQHIADIMRNARRFQSRHGFWPMQGWIDAFVRLGLVAAVGNGDYVLSRLPTAMEIAAVALPGDRPF